MRGPKLGRVLVTCNFFGDQLNTTKTRQLGMSPSNSSFLRSCLCKRFRPVTFARPNQRFIRTGAPVKAPSTITDSPEEALISQSLHNSPERRRILQEVSRDDSLVLVAPEQREQREPESWILPIQEAPRTSGTRNLHSRRSMPMNISSFVLLNQLTNFCSWPTN